MLSAYKLIHLVGLHKQWFYLEFLMTNLAYFFQDECKLEDIANLILDLVLKIAADLVGHPHD